MGSITRRPDRRWRARVYLPGGRQMARHFDRKVDAERWVTLEEGKLLRGEAVDPRRARTTVADYAAEWTASRAVRPSTMAQYRSHLEHHVLPELGGRPLVALRPSELQGWVRRLGETLSPATVETVARILGSMLRSAVADRAIPSSPMAGVRIPRPEHGRVVPLTPAQVGALLDAVPDHLRATVAVGAGCGLRVSEVCGLALEHVDFLRHTVRVERQLVSPSSAGGGWRFGPPKTRTSRRTVTLPEPVALELARHLERWPVVDVRGLGPLIFRTAPGGPLGRGRVADGLRPAVAAAGLPAGTTFHDLRHHCASLLIAAGLSVKAVQSILGHATAAETLDTYGHLWPAEEAEMRGAIERAWYAKEPPEPKLEGL